MKLTDYTLSLLRDIENRINPEIEDDFCAQYESFWNGTCEDAIFRPVRKKVSAPGVELKGIHINDALHDYDLMLAMQLEDISESLNHPSRALGLRANYGTGIMTSLFGTQVREMPREMNTLPITRSLNDSDAVRRILEAGSPDLNNGFGKDVFAFGELCGEAFQDYPKISRYVRMCHPDLQGPLDIAELLWGGEIFYEMYDDPDFIHALMQLITDTYIRCLDKWFDLFPPNDRLNIHWGLLYRGSIMLRDDSAMNLSPEMYGEFALPYDTRLLDYYGGGCVHFCGRGDHYIHKLAGIENLTCINLSQPHLNDMDRIYTEAFHAGKKLLGLGKDACKAYAMQPDAVKSMICTIE